MTYFYLFKTNEKMYAGQHRCPDNRDPMKDWYMGSGRDWCDYLDNNGWHHIKEFREHVERIILEVIYDEDRNKVGEAEKKWIAYIKEKYPTAICNISGGSNPSWHYATVEEAEMAIKTCKRAYSQTLEGKSRKKAWRDSPRGKAYDKAYSQIPEVKRKDKVNKWANRNNYPDPSIAKFPKGWNDDDKQEYIRQFNNR